MAFSPNLQFLYLAKKKNLQFLIFFFFLNLFSLTPLSLSFNIPHFIIPLEKGDIHDLLPKYNLPIGLLPGNVKSYTLSPEDNSFSIELTHHCYINFDDQLAYYDTHIRGKLGYGKVYDVHGIQAKKLFLWVSVTGMEVDEKSNMIEFHAGAFTQSLPAKDFQSIPICKEKGFPEIQILASF